MMHALVIQTVAAQAEENPDTLFLRRAQALGAGR
jgi:hypothetical protein